MSLPGTETAGPRGGGRRIWGDRNVRLGATLVGALILVAALAPVLSPHDPIAQPDLVSGQNAPPSWTHPLGTDLYSRDVLSRVLYGARISLAIAVLSVTISLTLGTAVGTIAGFVGGATDAVLMRAVDVALAIPRVFLLLVVLALWEGVGVVALVLILGLTSWFEMSRLVRAEVISVREREYIAATSALGLGTHRTLARHVLPNVVAPIIVHGTLGVGIMILIEAALSYLGVGVPQPTPSLGSMIREGQPLITQAPWISVVPGVAIVATVLSFSVLGEGLRRAMDPRAS